MKILWLNWKDLSHPQAGGAEIVTEEICKRLAADGHEVLLVAAGFPDCQEEESRDGYHIIRIGGRHSIYAKAWRYYREELKGQFDLVIDEMNTLPFFARFYAKERVILFTHQLCREIWYYQMPYPLSFFGFLLEPVYLWLLRKSRVITVSQSTKDDLCRYKFDPENISIISEGIQISPIEDLEESEEKYPLPTVLALGAFREMKRTAEIVTAFEHAKAKIPELKLVMAGDTSGEYGEIVLEQIRNSKYRDSIRCLGRVDEHTKTVLMQKSHVLCVTSVKEGWGLVVTEANSQGTPAVAYNVDGLRDSVKDGVTGLLSKENTPESLAEAIELLLSEPSIYEMTRKSAWEMSKKITFENCYRDFVKAAEVGS